LAGAQRCDDLDDAMREYPEAQPAGPGAPAHHHGLLAAKQRELLAGDAHRDAATRVAWSIARLASSSAASSAPPTRLVAMPWAASSPASACSGSWPAHTMMLSTSMNCSVPACSILSPPGSTPRYVTPESIFTPLRCRPSRCAQPVVLPSDRPGLPGDRCRSQISRPEPAGCGATPSTPALALSAPSMPHSVL